MVVEVTVKNIWPLLLSFEIVPVSDKITELEDVGVEEESEVVAAVEEGKETEAFGGETAKAEMADSVSEEAMGDA